ncbi:MAG: cellobiose phosphorylase [Candidatus Omnitrophica bacterium]|nr:cellobiose phosphorylase [Candidatus Omnitrophota bacterium]
MEGLKDKNPKYFLNSSGEFVIENYNFSKPFANFFPGIAGKYGIPMWVFYVNRGQCIVSCGTKDKDHSILEFFPANRAWQMVSSHGFRTFIKVLKKDAGLFYEPFHNGSSNLGFKLANQMRISSYDLKLEETNTSLGIKTEVEYFNIPSESYAALVRVLTLTNTSRNALKMQVLDGLAQIVPYGTANLFLKKLSRTIEAWMNVENLKNCAPYYKLDVDPTDRPEVIHIKGGNFYLAFHQDKKDSRMIRPIIDPQAVFGSVTDFSFPRRFMAEKHFKYPRTQMDRSKMPCGMLLLDVELGSKCQKKIYTLLGYMRSKELLNSSLKKITKTGYIALKKEENKNLIASLQEDIATESSSPEFNLYARQTYLDNIMRGGYPIVLNPQSQNQKSVFYLYSRKHGDLERDYNKFHIQATYFSQGNGNYRDANQNRRCEVWFNPQVEDENINTFFNLLQTDGFNPLVVKGITLTLKNINDFKAELNSLIDDGVEKLEQFLSRPFTPGELIIFILENNIKLKASPDEFLELLIPYCQKTQEAEHGEGYWTDHWTYNLDLLENYLGVYPERFKGLLFEKKSFCFFDNTEVVKPREDKYILKDGTVRQFHSLLASNSKREMIKRRLEQPHLVRTIYGKGQIYYTTLFNKLLCLFVNKLASLDPFGVGIEMEANKPNWYDALNGLPGLLGSSLCETLELKRLAIFIKDVLQKAGPDKIDITEEVYDFLTGLDKQLKAYLENNNPERDFQYWDKSNNLKEDYRRKTKMGLSGKETPMSSSELLLILDNSFQKLEIGIKKAKDKKNNVYYAYFINEVSEFKPLTPPYVKPLRFTQKRLPLFLESQMHALRLAKSPKDAASLYKATKKSPLYDKKLKMYKITANLKKMPEEIGRCRVFTTGWLEHESIWLHMEYKYLLEVLKSGLYREFYADFKNALIPFQNPGRYGRSILENSSFLVSSAFPDNKLHGNGFVARLSGSTAEFLQMWLLINTGLKPFYVNAKNELNLKFSPILAGWLFKRKTKTYGFKFLGRISVIYHNPNTKNTFSSNRAKIKKITFEDKDNNRVEISSDIIPAPYAEQVRSQLIEKIDIYLD